MKNKSMFKNIILSILLILPMFVKADTYNNEVNTTNEYILRSDYINDYQRYLIDGKLKTIPFGYSKGALGIVNEFRMGGFISYDEYMITSNSTTTNSYLYDGIKYWTLTSDGSKKYVVGDETSKSTSESYRNKTTEFAIDNVKVTGSGTVKDPWIFEPIYKVELKAEGGTIEYPNGQYVGRDDILVLTATPNSGYRYITNDCGIYFESYDKATNSVSISRVNRDIGCNIIFGLGIYKLTLEEDDVRPQEFYLRYQEGFYRDEIGQTTFRSLDKKPEKVGYTFKGYEYTERDGTKDKIIDANGKVDNSKKGTIIEDATLKALWEANKYKVTLDPNGGTLTQTEMTVTFDSQYGVLPDPKYKGYGFDGWYTEKTGGAKVTSTDTVKTPNDHKLYAHWTYCAAGTYNDGTTSVCTSCPSGNYCTGGSAKAQCAAGKYRGSIGAKTEAECVPCAANKWSSDGSASCTACPTGYLVESGKGVAQTSCYIPVPAGQTLTAKNGTTFTDCAAGTAKAAHNVNYGSADTACSTCGVNTYATAKSGSCTNCASGYTVAEGKGTSAASCTRTIPAGQQVTTKGGAPTNCGANSYSSQVTINQTQTTGCTSCASGYTNGGAGTSAASCTRSIPAGQQVTTPGGAPTNCGVNSYSAQRTINQTQTTGCTSCATGYGNNGGGTSAASCTRTIPAGQRVTTAGGAPTNCGANTYSTQRTINQTQTTGCTGCASGYTVAAGQGTSASSCTRTIPAGQQVTTAEGAPTNCGANSYSAQRTINQTQTSGCTACASGYTNGGAGTSASSCTRSIPAGQQVTTAGGGTSNCGANSYSVKRTINQTQTSGCTACAAGYGNGGAGTSASSCTMTIPAGQQVTSAGGAPYNCGVNSYSAQRTINQTQTSGCTGCAAGYGNGGAGTSAASCTITIPAGQQVTSAGGAPYNCGVNSYSAQRTINQTQTSGCTGCAAGYGNGGAGTSEASCTITIPAGKQVTTPGGAPTNCAAGTISAERTINQTQTSGCSNCGSGYWSNEGASYCYSLKTYTCCKSASQSNVRTYTVASGASCTAKAKEICMVRPDGVTTKTCVCYVPSCSSGTLSGSQCCITSSSKLSGYTCS